MAGNSSRSRVTVAAIVFRLGTRRGDAHLQRVRRRNAPCRWRARAGPDGLKPRSPRDRSDRLDPARSAAVKTAFWCASGTAIPRILGVRERTAQEGDILHSGKTQIGHILAAAPQKAVVFLAQEPRADALLCQSDPTSSHSPDECPDRPIGRLRQSGATHNSL